MDWYAEKNSQNHTLWHQFDTKPSSVLACTVNWCVYMQEKLGLILEKEDEMECLVGGCNFLLKAIRHEAFTYENGALNFVTNTGK